MYLLSIPSWRVLPVLFLFLILMSCKHSESPKHEVGILTATNPIYIDTFVFDEFVCQIHSFQRIELRALEKGYLQDVLVDEGQLIRKGQLLFQIQPTIYEAELLRSQAELEAARIEYENTLALAENKIVSQSEVALAKAKLEKARAELKLSQVHLGFTRITAPFDGIVGKFEDVRLGSLLEEGELLTTLSDNSKMWVYFNVPEALYLDYVSGIGANTSREVKLRLANNRLFDQEGIIETIESDFNNTTGNIAFRATFQNPERILRHGQTGTILWPRRLEKALAIPQKATYEVLDKKFVFVVDDQGLVQSREIVIAQELNHVYLLKEGLAPNEKILIDGLRKVGSGEVIDFEFEEPATVFSHLELHAE